MALHSFLIFFIVTVSLLSGSNVSAITCYDCMGTDLDNCTQLVCEKEDSVYKENLCYKMVINFDEIPAAKGKPGKPAWTSVSRGCDQKNSDRMGGCHTYNRTTEFEKEACYCDTDLCNSKESIRAWKSIILIISSSALAIVVSFS